jgi:hypothetical protein
MLKSDLLRLLQQEIRRHDFSTFIDEPPSMAKGGRGVCVPGCATCRKPLQSVTQFIEHLTNDVLPKIFNSEHPQTTTVQMRTFIPSVSK